MRIRGFSSTGRLAALAALVLALAASRAGAGPADQAAPSPVAGRPNIIFVLTDDLDAASLDRLPELQGMLAGQGTSFSNFFVNVSLCCPSRSSVLRGQYANNHHVSTNRPPAGGFETFHALGNEDSTVATWLKAAGYRTALLGKYLNGYPNSVDPTYVPPGWDEWDSPAGGNPYSEYRYQLNENGRLVRYGDRPQDYLTDVLADKANGVIRRATADGVPLFMEIATYAPHQPATPAPRHQDAFSGVTAPRPPSFDEEDVSDKPAWVQDRPRLTPRAETTLDQLYRRRLQSMLAVQEMVAGLLRTLEETGQIATTYLFFSSDNGFHLGQHRQLTGKQAPYEEDIRVPLIVRGPGVPAGRTLDHLTGNVDLAPTFADLAGAGVPDFVDGRSLAPLLSADPPAAETWRQAYLIEHTGGQQTRQAVRNARPGRGRAAAGAGLLEPMDADEVQVTQARARGAIPTFQGLRTPDYTYVEYATGERELYTLRADPYQLQNRAATADPALLRQLAAWLDTVRRCAGAMCRAAEAVPP